MRQNTRNRNSLFPFLMVNEVLSFRMEQFVSLIHASLGPGVDKGLTDIELRTALVSVGKCNSLHDLQIYSFFQVVAKESHSEVLMHWFSTELRQGVVLVIKQRSFLSFSQIFLQFWFDLIDRCIPRRHHSLLSEGTRQIFRRRSYGKPCDAAEAG